MKQAGVYKITNIINNKIYVGCSVDIDSRKYAHFYELKNNNHQNRHLQSAYNKYGKNNLKFEIIEYIDCKENTQESILLLLDREQHWMDYYKSYDSNAGYNIESKASTNYKNKRRNGIYQMKQRTIKKIVNDLVMDSLSRNELFILSELGFTTEIINEMQSKYQSFQEYGADFKFVYLDSILDYNNFVIDDIVEIYSRNIKNENNNKVKVILPDNTIVFLKNHNTYQERLQELYNSIPFIGDYLIRKKDMVSKFERSIAIKDEYNLNNLLNDCETYWLGVRNQNGKWSEKVKSCLDVIATYLLRAPDSGIKNVILH